MVRAVAMDSTDGLAKSGPWQLKIQAHLYTVPVGQDGVLGRMFDLLGNTIDEKGRGYYF